MRAPLLVELLTEELPPKSLQRLGSAFAGAIAAGLAQAGLVDAAAAAASRGYCTPRRLAVLVPDVAAQAAAREIQVKGPSVAIGLGADGQPTVALRKWAERQGAALDALTRGSDGKQEVFFWRSVAAGAALADAIQGILDAALASLPIAKVMKYQLADGATTVSFVRPAHRLVVLHGAEVVPCRVLGLDAGRLTEGHRFRSHGAVAIEQADAYPELLAAHHVIAGFDDRRAAVAAAIEAQRSALGAQLAVGAAEQAQVAALLDEVTALVESPAVYVGAFDAAYLQVPQECLILSMRTNQKYFPLFDADGRLQNRFLIVSNMAIADPSAIIDGNQRVVRPRLADARFFYDQDRRQPLADRVGRLASVVYHARLGAQADRVRRIGQHAAANGGAHGVPAPAVARAALLAKADLLTGMVGEFPELQGIMGRYYARHDG
ncbi:MAG: glycine--tRNA ligase subunit beta, partial [Lautropia sp.]